MIFWLVKTISYREKPVLAKKIKIKSEYEKNAYILQQA
jgi:hypothetical protein